MANPQTEFEWDNRKAESNLRKHKVSFDEAKTSFNDPNAFIFDDPQHSEDEPRELLIGYSNRNRLLIVAFVQRIYDVICIISARLTTSRERKKYEQEKRF